MLHRRTARNGAVFYASPLLEELGIPHAFTTRLGGVSPAPFDSLNLGNPNGCPVQDDPRRIGENYQRIQAAIDCAEHELCRVHQVHGRDVVVLSGRQKCDNSRQADALVGEIPGQLLSVRIADCVPVLIASRDGRTVAAVHAGWRGIVAGVIPSAVQVMTRSIRADELYAAIGPCIGPSAYEVGIDVLQEFERVFGDQAPIERRVGERGMVDLRRAAKLQLLAVGLPRRQIDMSDRCTYQHPDEFFSHRRDNGVTGRMAALISAKA